jgi:ribosomal protein S18 acetylase RimI-like enzyme
MIRRLENKDLKEFGRLMFELYNKWDHMDPIDKIDKSWFCSNKHHNFVKKLMKKNNCRILVYEKDQKIVAYLTAFIEERQPFLKKVGYISETYTSKEFRGQGIGKQLVKETFKWFRKNKLEWFTVSTHSKDKEANSFWKKRGFVEFNKNFKMKS